MNDLIDQMQRAISSSNTPGGAAQKCADIARSYTAKVLETLTLYKSKNGDHVYTNIVKTKMMVENKEI